MKAMKQLYDMLTSRLEEYELKMQYEPSQMLAGRIVELKDVLGSVDDFLFDD